MKNPTRTDALLANAVFTLTFFFFIPYALYLNNMQEFLTDRVALARLLLFCWGCAFLFLSVPFLLAQGSLRVYCISCAAFLSAAMWMQANILNWDYGILDGASLLWRPFEIRSVVDAGVWLFLFLIIVIPGIRKRFSFRTLFVALLAVQTLNSFITYASSDATMSQTQDESGEVAINWDNQFTFSRDKNVIVIVLDAYQTDVFNEYIETYPAYKDALPGFTYYPDALAESFFTAFSVPNIMTGKRLFRQLFPSASAYQKTWEDSLKNHSLFALLKGAGYHVGIYPLYAQRQYDPEIFSHIADNFSREEAVLAPYYAGEIKSLLSVALFRAVPHLFKKSIHERLLLGAASEQDRDVFLHSVQHSMYTGTDVPCLRYYHLQGVHPPQIIAGETVDFLERENTIEIAGLVNTMLAAFVARLQELNIYDNTEILIVGDHGLYWGADEIEYGRFDGEEARLGTSPDAFVKKQRALPLVLYKPAHAHGPLKLSSAPVSLADIMPTVVESADLEPDDTLQGIPLQQAEEDAARVRHYFTSEYRRRMSEPLYEFVVSGFSWYSASWTYTGNTYVNGRIERTPLDNYQPGDLLTFGHFGSANQYLVENWSPNEASHSIEGGRASLALPLASTAPTMTLHVDVAPASATNASGDQTVVIFVNEKKIGPFLVSGRQAIAAELPIDPSWTSAPVPARPAVSPTRPWLTLPPPLSDAVASITIEVSETLAANANGEANMNAGATLDIYALLIDVAS